MKGFLENYTAVGKELKGENKELKDQIEILTTQNKILKDCYFDEKSEANGKYFGGFLNKIKTAIFDDKIKNDEKSIESFKNFLMENIIINDSLNSLDIEYLNQLVIPESNWNDSKQIIEFKQKIIERNYLKLIESVNIINKNKEIINEIVNMSIECNDDNGEINLDDVDFDSWKEDIKIRKLTDKEKKDAEKAYSSSTFINNINNTGRFGNVKSKEIYNDENEDFEYTSYNNKKSVNANENFSKLNNNKYSSVSSSNMNDLDNKMKIKQNSNVEKENEAKKPDFKQHNYISNNNSNSNKGSNNDNENSLNNTQKKDKAIEIELAPKIIRNITKPPSKINNKNNKQNSIFDDLLEVPISKINKENNNIEKDNNLKTLNDTKINIMTVDSNKVKNQSALKRKLLF